MVPFLQLFNICLQFIIILKIFSVKHIFSIFFRETIFFPWNIFFRETYFFRENYFFRETCFSAKTIFPWKTFFCEKNIFPWFFCEQIFFSAVEVDRAKVVKQCSNKEYTENRASTLQNKQKACEAQGGNHLAWLGMWSCLKSLEPPVLKTSTSLDYMEAIWWTHQNNKQHD